jgi:hypothetical protein
MKSLPPPDDALFDVGDLGARVATIREALEAGYIGTALTIARQLASEVDAVAERLAQAVARECGFEHVSGLAEAELSRLGGDAAS